MGESAIVQRMSLRVDSRFAGGNVAAVRVVESASAAEVEFAAHPCGGSESLWFFFRVVASAPGEPHPNSLTLTAKFLRNMTGCASPASLRPVYRGEGQNWNRTKTGVVSTAADGLASVSWTIPYPEPSTEFALCYPYGMQEVKTLVRKSKAYWEMAPIGLSMGGRPIQRISNVVDRAAQRPGIFLVARQHGGETPGSWVLDGMLQHFARTHESRVLVWAVPLVDVGGIEHGHYGRGGIDLDLDRAWGVHPLRYETRVIQGDLAEWKTRCRPALILDLQATGGSESDGIYCRLPQGEGGNGAARDAEKWANVFREALTDEYAAADFKHALETSPDQTGMSLGCYARDVLETGALTLAAPYALCGKMSMTPKQYREAGRRIARSAVRRILGG